MRKARNPFPRTTCPDCKEDCAYHPTTGRIMRHMLTEPHGNDLCPVSHDGDAEARYVEVPA